jgi:lysozyme
VSKAFAEELFDAYPDSRGIPTIGIGYMSMAGPPHVYWGLMITDDQVKAILTQDLAPIEATINACVHVPINQNQF